MGRSEKAIKYSNMYEAFQKVARIDDAEDTQTFIDQKEWRKFWETPEAYSASGARNTPESDSSGSGVSIGVVAACTVAAVGAGIGVGYFAKGRASATSTESTAEEKQSEWEKQDANEL
jgi:uncharacterized protein HemX